MTATRGTAALTAAGVAHTVHTYPHERKGALPAAEALGLPPARVAKTLVIEADGEPAFAILPGDAELSLKRAARALGARAAAMADPHAAERLTGYRTGGISAFGSRRALPVLVEARLMDHGSVFVNAGGRGVMVELAPADLVAAAGGTVAELAA
jgi:Cys-tRNA(Pro)/Cys-tRNA(Cys) deacylase